MLFVLYLLFFTSVSESDVFDSLNSELVYSGDLSSVLSASHGGIVEFCLQAYSISGNKLAKRNA